MGRLCQDGADIYAPEGWLNPSHIGRKYLVLGPSGELLCLARVPLHMTSHEVCHHRGHGSCLPARTYVCIGNFIQDLLTLTSGAKLRLFQCHSFKNRQKVALYCPIVETFPPGPEHTLVARTEFYAGTQTWLSSGGSAQHALKGHSCSAESLPLQRPCHWPLSSSNISFRRFQTGLNTT